MLGKCLAQCLARTCESPLGAVTVMTAAPARKCALTQSFNTRVLSTSWAYPACSAQHGQKIQFQGGQRR